ncbi:hypothetical protein EVAR_53828_1 [Eumeta japonica]|uniref:Uncharacterized protein n=1 Tax=Eumeta variegata TaxID=151549 RepID=A0A4C1ZIN4_EUMVA|nr:hypothetical protein EVAR_53828_1 [Eumeta japonica]
MKDVINLKLSAKLIHVAGKAFRCRRYPIRNQETGNALVTLQGCECSWALTTTYYLLVSWGENKIQLGKRFDWGLGGCADLDDDKTRVTKRLVRWLSARLGSLIADVIATMIAIRTNSQRALRDTGRVI